MKLPENDRYDYIPINQRPVYDWPNGTRLAVVLSNNLEHFAFKAGVGLNDSAVDADPSHRNSAWRDYGNRIGIWRMFEAFDELDLPLSHNINSEVMARYPDIIAKVIERDDELVAHGRTNSERSSNFWEDDEERFISEITDEITKHWGQRPTGWMGPSIAESAVTSDLLKEAGYNYTMQWPCDDQPIYIKTRSEPILNIPYPVEMNDVGIFVRRHNTGREFAEMMIDQFDEMLEQSAKQPLVYSISLHPFLVGQPFRMRPLREALKHIAERRDDVWLTQPRHIASHIASLPAGVVPAC